ncbi:hypothetical protein M409DRAFT_64115 [Zasmidium cellare ATCC 36951]|uniref:Nucleoside phosphorylase domain-containing protein n=1 Tax=Zasmidium cellare ATCC 36951 TaxID=1080233 RepID=A0A6A6CY91_ZASCE|nr:uncharacterized protein M409DRAFT_64115 [Zasmidium cellare ATCC 36951]KAF2170336.1 hypothetical protein M409DRAFT_64115 [Zasmidium cellare ATCC 36951]
MSRQPVMRRFQPPGREALRPDAAPTSAPTLLHPAPSVSGGKRSTPKSRQDEYTVGWICALPVPEWQASQILLDEEHEDVLISPPTTYSYVFGKINGHGVVMGCLPEASMGTTSAAAVAAEMRAVFKALRFCLMVGIGGGVWSEKADVRLGDVVVSRPDPVARTGGVIQWDFGKAIQGGEFQMTGSLNSVPETLLSAVGKVKATLLHKSKFPEYLKAYSQYQDSYPEYANRPNAPDRLFAPSFEHPQGKDTCDSCPREQEILRPERPSNRPVVHYGTIASGNAVMRDGERRDRIASQHGGILCFEMEAAGLMNRFPCLVIRGICDYCDSHKNKQWHSYASAAAAAWAKELLRNIQPSLLSNENTIDEQTSS